MPKVTWDDNLEKLAKEAVSDCIFAHNNNHGKGENLYMVGSTTINVDSMMNSWGKEVKLWTCSSNTCIPGA